MMRFVKKLKWFTLLVVALAPLAWGGSALPAGGRLELPLNDGWKFERLDSPSITTPTNPFVAAFDDTAWENVRLPHTVRIEPPESAFHYFQGLCWYRRHILQDVAWHGKKVSLLFEGAMQVADVWVTGRHVLTHRGGYLPFTVDLTAALTEPGGAVIAVRLDNTDQPLIPPGKKHDQLDFSYFGGLYRDVRLVVTDPLHLTDPVAAQRVAGGGIFIRTESASSASADLIAPRERSG